MILPFFWLCCIVYQNAFKIYILPYTTAYNNVQIFFIGCSYYCVMYDTPKWFPLNIRRHLHWLQYVFILMIRYLQQDFIPYTFQFFLSILFSTPSWKKWFWMKAFKYKAPVFEIIYQYTCHTVLWVLQRELAPSSFYFLIFVTLTWFR